MPTSTVGTTVIHLRSNPKRGRRHSAAVVVTPSAIMAVVADIFTSPGTTHRTGVSMSGVEVTWCSTLKESLDRKLTVSPVVPSGVPSSRSDTLSGMPGSKVPGGFHSRTFLVFHESGSSSRSGPLGFVPVLGDHHMLSFPMSSHSVGITSVKFARESMKASYVSVNSRRRFSEPAGRYVSEPHASY